MRIGFGRCNAPGPVEAVTCIGFMAKPKPPLRAEAFAIDTVIEISHPFGGAPEDAKARLLRRRFRRTPSPTAGLRPADT